MRVAISPRSFRNTTGRHLDLLSQSPLEPRYPTQDRHLSEAEMVELVDGCQALIVGVDPVTDAVLAAGPLRAVVKYGSGLDNIDLGAAERRGVEVASTPGTNARAVAELTIGLMLALARHITFHDRSAREGSWQRRTGVELSGRRLGIVGYGEVGRRVASIARSLGMEVVAHDPYVAEAEIRLVGLERLLETSHVVSLHAPLTETTHHLIDVRALERMRPGALLVNTARGGLVDEEALTRALASGRLGGAAVDDVVGETIADPPLLGLDSFIASPHAGAASLEAVERTGVAAVEELLVLLDLPRGTRGAVSP